MSDILDILVSAPPGAEISVAIEEPDAAPVTLVLPAPVPVEVRVAASLPGASVTPVILTLAAYLALTAPEQLDPTRWYVIPKSI